MESTSIIQRPKEIHEKRPTEFNFEVPPDTTARGLIDNFNPSQSLPDPLTGFFNPDILKGVIQGMPRELLDEPIPEGKFKLVVYNRTGRGLSFNDMKREIKEEFGEHAEFPDPQTSLFIILRGGVKIMERYPHIATSYGRDRRIPIDNSQSDSADMQTMSVGIDHTKQKPIVASYAYAPNSETFNRAFVVIREELSK